MLAQNFKTAHELSLHKEHYEALIKTLVMLETGKLKHSNDAEPSEAIVFNMNNWNLKEELLLEEVASKAIIRSTVLLLETEQLTHKAFYRDANNKVFTTQCHTVACIGGSAELIGGLKRGALRHAAEGNDALTALFFPHMPNWYAITTEQAAAALRSYLTTGWPDWDKADSMSRLTFYID